MSYILNGSHWQLGDPMSIPNLLLAQLSLTFVSVAIGLAIAFPIALVVMISRPSYFPFLNPANYYGGVIGLASLAYTIPSLAFMAFLIPVTGLMPATIIIPLVVYTQVVLIRNIIAAVRAVDPTMVDVGRAMGMNGFQLQRYVVLPLALPVIIAGIRVVTVTTIGIATLAPLIGVPDLGTLVFQGMNYSYFDEVVAGIVVVTALAVGADLLLLALQRWLSRGRQIVPAT